MDQIPPTCHHQRHIYQQHIICRPNSHTMVRCLQVLSWRLQYSKNGLAWIWRIPHEWNVNLKLNLLYFLA